MSSNFYRNEYYVHNSSKLFNKYFFFYNNVTLFDIIMYDPCGVDFLKKNSNAKIVRYYNYTSDTYVNFLGNDFYNLNLYGDFNWLFRECYEFFDLGKVSVKSDCRNLLTNYSNRSLFLLKKTPLSGFKDFKNHFSLVKPFNKNSVILNLVKIWIYTILTFCMLFLFLVASNVNSVVLFFIYSELFWMFTYTMTLFFSFYTNDPFFILLGFTVFYIAAFEAIVVGLILCNHIK